MISAAHCFYLDNDNSVPPVSMFKIAAGKVHRDLNAQERLPTQVKDVESIKLDPRYEGINGYYYADIAVVAIKDFFQYQLNISPVCMDLGAKTAAAVSIFQLFAQILFHYLIITENSGRWNFGTRCRLGTN